MNNGVLPKLLKEWFEVDSRFEDVLWKVEFWIKLLVSSLHTCKIIVNKIRPSQRDVCASMTGLVVSRGKFHSLLCNEGAYKATRDERKCGDQHTMKQSVCKN
jgi:hypothetical protein